MKLVTFQQRATTRLGILAGESIFPVSGEGLPHTMKDLIEGGDDLLDRVRQAFDHGLFSPVPQGKVNLLAPLPNPQKIMAIGHNYMDHIREQNAPVPTHPIVFTKFPTSIIGPTDAIQYDLALTRQVDIEVELGVVIGKTARKVAKEAALEYVFGYTILNDVSARDLQFGDKQWVRGKSLDTFCPTGPCIVTADEIGDPQALHIHSQINDFVMQDSSTHEMIFNVRTLIAFLSQAFTLLPGDMIASGTPNGVGQFRSPQIFLKNGDVVMMEIEKIGRLVNPVICG
jgi:2-keto-4-pentenoate hydratase/2-oxohepta-3-ene-1,7-dioic acid hydratase in catechol pathway